MNNLFYTLICAIFMNFSWATSIENMIIDNILIEEKSYKESCEIIDAKIRESELKNSSYKGIIYMGSTRGNVFLHITKGKVLDVIKYFAEAANCKYLIENDYILIYPFAQETIIINLDDEFAKKIGITANNKNDTKHIQKLLKEFGVELELDAIRVIENSILITSDEEKIKILNSYVCLLKYGWKISK